MTNRAMNIVVKEYDANWVHQFQKEARLIRKVLEGEILEIYHIGSTAVPGLKAKPIIDIMPVVNKIENVDGFNSKMIDIGYEPLGEFGMAGRRYFRKGGENRTHQVHFFQVDHVYEIERHIAVRDYLKSHLKDVQEYGELKVHLAKRFPKDIEGYSVGKDAFVKDLERRALLWWQERIQ
ncbi:hypothetical protein TCA2_3204 [Paenibacillus sp. TCA20]|nr:GrpB family protein [Paenibacillus sp. TCA20]GAK40714.1 hypothetical protein TCA2_3204 [Paenibacillus sp. TCA20]